MSRFATIDLGQLPSPEVVEALDFEAYLKDFMVDFKARAAEAGFDYDLDWVDGQTDFLESDPVVKVLEVAAYRETILRQRINDAARQVMLPFAGAGNLENLGAFFRVKRMSVTTVEGINEVTTWETDARYRARVALAPEAYTCAGSEGAYRFFAMGADMSIKSVGVITPNQGDGEVHVLPLVDTGDGTPSANVLGLVREAISPKERRPLTDIVQVRAPGVPTYVIDVVLQVPLGPDTALVKAEAEKKLAAYAAARHSVGLTVYLSSITAAASVGGVENALINSPAANVVPEEDEAAYCTAINVVVEVLT